MPSISSGSAKVSFPRHSREKVIRQLRGKVAALKEVLPIIRVVLFGSYATDRYTAASDIDVLVVYAGAPVPDAYAWVKRTLGLVGVEPHVYTEEEARLLQERINRMTHAGVRIYPKSEHLV